MNYPDFINWKTRDGESIPIPLMDSDHIINAMKWIEKNGFHLTTIFESGGLDADGPYYDEYSETKDFSLHHYAMGIELRLRKLEGRL